MHNQKVSLNLGGIEPGILGMQVLCSTNELPELHIIIYTNTINKVEAIVTQPLRGARGKTVNPICLLGGLGNYHEFDVWKNVNFVKNGTLKMWILWKMRFQKCEFYEKWDFQNVNFVKNCDFKNVNYVKNEIFWIKCGFLPPCVLRAKRATFFENKSWKTIVFAEQWWDVRKKVRQMVVYIFLWSESAEGGASYYWKLHHLRYVEFSGDI